MLKTKKIDTIADTKKPLLRAGRPLERQITKGSLFPQFPQHFEINGILATLSPLAATIYLS
ncbi:MAG: hypothetical protein DYG98_05485 [Haliscomenobacteraceae bacterium CHB4]|nr:hypothetical protein [Haliscomenobacteraceae bacterium CHB4]